MRFFVEWVFEDYLDLNYEYDCIKGFFFFNVKVIEFYFLVGKYMYD